MATHSLFFYGTLCHAGVLSRVIGNPGDHLTTRDAVLLDHARLHVEGEDYPAVVSTADGEKVLARRLSLDEASVRGVLVTGLTDEDVRLLDEFEGDEYTRSPCSVSVLPTLGSSLVPSPPTHATVYRWTAPISRLAPQIWTFEEFLRDSAHRWVGVGANDNPDYAEVDRRRAMGGFITPRGVQEEARKVEQEIKEGKLDAKLDDVVHESVAFGKALRERYWRFEKDWVNINNGSYGVAPAPVITRFRELQDRIDSAPDRFMKVEYPTHLLELRTRLAQLADCDTGDLVMVPSATSGVDTVLRSLSTQWQKGDRLLYISPTIYKSASGSLESIVDSHPSLGLSLLPIQVTYPISHDDLVSAVTCAIDEAESDGTGRKIRLALVDAISSNPGVVVPWERLVKLFRERDIMSLVDGAHQIGQLPLSLRTSQPDFFVSNCHKWLHAHRACAFLYVSKPRQHLMHASPIGYGYKKRSPAEGASWTDEFFWTSTLDWSPILSTLAALDFRRDVLGGEERIYEYCYNLAVEGGELVAEMLGTKVMRNPPGQGELIASMVNVELPLPAPSSISSTQFTEISAFWLDQLVETHHTHVPAFPHGDKFYTRLSAQVYVDLDDFRYIGNVLKRVCEQIRNGEHRREANAEQGAPVEAVEAVEAEGL
ncbi:hypothetical protein JCM10207_005520 [Rhodosporidiobolus poonsookiae]